MFAMAILESWHHVLLSLLVVQVYGENVNISGMLRLGRCRAESLDAVGDVQKRGLFERLGGSHGHGRAACERR